jgi:hypothetical protein
MPIGFTEARLIGDNLHRGVDGRPPGLVRRKAEVVVADVSAHGVALMFKRNDSRKMVARSSVGTRKYEKPTLTPLGHVANVTKKSGSGADNDNHPSKK